jgi:DNA-binding transcriptional LysR family regulator
MIHPEALRYFMELTRTLNMSRAAERLGVTQSTLSHSLRRLEESLGEDLFVRSKRGLRLTASGGHLLERAQELQNCWDAVAKSVHEETGEVKGRVRLGCHTAVAQYTLPLFLPKLLKANPLLTVTLSHGLSRHMTEQVVSGGLDLALAINPRPHPDLVIKELLRDRVTVWMAAGCLNPDVLIVEPELVQSQDVLGKLRKKGNNYSRVIESSSLEVIAQLMNAGVGCAILPERVVQAFSTVKAHAVKGAPVFQDRMCAVYKPELRRTEKGKAVLKGLLF